MNADYFFIDKFINLDFNSRFLMNFLIDKNFVENNRKELLFRIEELSLVQFLKVFIFILKNKEEDIDINLNRKYLEMFFEFISDDFENPIFRIKCNHFHWEEFQDFSIKNNSLSNEKALEKFDKTFYNSIKLNIKILLGLLELKKRELKNNIEKKKFIIKDLDYIINTLKTIRYSETNNTTLFGVTKEDKKVKYQNNLPLNKLEKLYSNFIKYDLINIETSLKSWIDVLTKEHNNHNSTIRLNLSYPQIYFLFKKLKELYNINLSPSEVNRTGNILNKKGDKINLKSFNSSVSRNKSNSYTPKDAEKILKALKG